MVTAKSASRARARTDAKSKSRAKAPVPVADNEPIMLEQHLFLAVIRERTWPLLAAVIIPIVVGYFLDEFFLTFPGLTIAGILVATLDVVLVMLRAIGGNFKK